MFLSTLEKIYIAITKWTVFIVTSMVAITAIFGMIYLPKLYLDTKSTSYDKTEYTMENPSVGFNEIMASDDARVVSFQGIKTYVFSIIQNGSEGHGYAIGAMPPKLIENDAAIEVAAYVANKRAGEVPEAFSKCTACHGQDGRGNNGTAPSLISLPIYNHQRERVATQMKVNKTAVKDSTYTALIDLRATRSSREVKMDYIMTNINKYALHASQDGTSRQGLITFIVSYNGGIVDNYMSEFLAQLSDATDKLLDYGYQLDKKEKFGITAIDWRDFIEKFSRSFSAKVSSELKKKNFHDNAQNNIANEKINKAIEAQTQMMVVGGIVGGALLTFLLLTLILIFIRVEKNTRKEEGFCLNTECVSKKETK